MKDDEDGGREASRQRADEIPECLDPARGRADGNDVDAPTSVSGRHRTSVLPRRLDGTP
jgi:hypothetical protein